MGEVYRARDTRLKREVALKILPESYATDPERLARFQREAEVLASLNHPNIVAIHGIEEGSASAFAAATADGEAGHLVRALVLELVEGGTLADRIARSGGPEGPPLRGLGRSAGSSDPGGDPAIPIDEALQIARQIAVALETAHEKFVGQRSRSNGWRRR